MKDSIILTPKGDRLEFYNLDRELNDINPTAMIRRAGFWDYKWHNLDDDQVMGIILMSIKYLRAKVEYLKYHKIETEVNISVAEKRIQDLESLFKPKKVKLVKKKQKKRKSKMSKAADKAWVKRKEKWPPNGVKKTSTKK